MKLLEILVYFRDFCEEHNLRFFITGGTLLGAIRHKGFIPWDDDVDVVMLREDYDKLIRIWNTEADTSRFVCSVSTKEKCARFPMATIRSVNTTCIYNHSVNDDIPQGLKIDVEFLDALPKGFFRRKLHSLCEGLTGFFYTQRIPERLPFRKVLECRILLLLFPTKKMRWWCAMLCEKYIKKFNPPKEGDLVRYGLTKARPYDYFKDVVWVDFEGEKFPAAVGYDETLTVSYGDYMQLPPESDRKPATDNLVFYDLDNGYEKYKGIYYCVKKA